MTFALLSAVYGLGWIDINAMPIAAIEAYVERIPNILALKKQIAGEGATVPHMENWKDILRGWGKTAFGDEKKVIATPGMLKMIGIGVKHA